MTWLLGMVVVNLVVWVWIARAARRERIEELRLLAGEPPRIGADR